MSQSSHDTHEHAEPDDAPGWHAIDTALQAVYGDQEPWHTGSVLKVALGGDDPLDGISIYRNEQERPHWHYVTYGFTELHGPPDGNDEKDSAAEFDDDDMEDSADEDDAEDDENLSGYGFELTFRLAIADGETEPPAWPISLMQNLARYVFRTGNVFEPGHWMTANGPICLGSDTLLTEMAFVQDPQLPPIDSPQGKLSFLQIVGLTADELRESKRWNSRGALQAMQPHMPLFINDLARPSLHDQPDVRAAITHGQETEGSSTAFIFASVLGIERHKRLLRGDQITITLGCLAVSDLKQLLPARLPHGGALMLSSGEHLLSFEPAEQGVQLRWDSDTSLTLALGPQPLQAWLQSVKARTGDYQVPGIDHIIWRVEASVIRDREGNVVSVYEEAE